MRIEDLGWDSRLESLFTRYRSQRLAPARVVRVERERYRIAGEGGERPAAVSGRLRHEATRGADFPAVGDWVAAAFLPGGDGAVIHAVLPRSSCFSRRAPGESTEEQVIVANVDLAFVVCGLDGDFNLRRVERYLASVWESGARPVVLLNKSDVAAAPEERRCEIVAAAPGVPVHVVSALEGTGLEALRGHLRPGRTIALLGSSGAGKSTLANALLGEPRLAVSAVRESDSRGRHTTARRELFVLPGGALLVDGPGMRQLQLWVAEESLETAFTDVEEHARDCRFRDCAHEGEPGCAVATAVSPQRLASWRKLQRELRATAARHDHRLRLEEKRRWRSIAKEMRRRPDKRGRL